MDKESLVSQIKQLQRTDPKGKLQWGEYCEKYLGSKRDPNAHDVSILEDFVNSYNAGALPAPGTGGAPTGSLADQVKNLQRNDPTAKLQWGEYCDTYLGGKRDPNAHDQSVLENFVQSYHQGVLPKPSAAAGAGAAPWGGKGGAAMGKGAQPQPWGGAGATAAPTPMMAAILGGAAGGAGAGSPADFIKTGQRQSQSWKAAWQTYCTNYGNGKFDPSVHTPDFIKNFIEYVGGLALKDLGGAAPGPAAFGKRPAEAMGAFGPAAKKMNMGMPMGGGDPEKMGLVSKVKEFQKSSPEAKEAWGQYCDSWLGGVRDPNRHDTDTLRTFVEQNCP